jgi:hypothetical protein
MAGKEEKRAITVVMAISDAGDVSPPQIIFKGKTKASLPSSTSPFWAEATNIGDTDTYWSIFDLMCKLIVDILIPYFTAQKLRYDVPECVLQVDVWTVHRQIAFRTSI